MTATPYALVCYPDADRPFPPPRSPLEFVGPDKLSVVRRWASAPHAPAPLRPAHTPRPDTHIQDKPGVLLSKEKKKWKEERIFQESYRAQSLGTGLALH